MSTEEGTAARWQTSTTAYWIEASRQGSQDPLKALNALRHARDDINEAIGLWVAAARRDRVPWSRIGQALDVTRQAAQQGHRRRTTYLEERHQRARYDRDLPPLPAPRWRLWWRRRATRRAAA